MGPEPGPKPPVGVAVASSSSQTEPCVSEMIVPSWENCSAIFKKFSLHPAEGPSTPGHQHSQQGQIPVLLKQFLGGSSHWR